MTESIYTQKTIGVTELDKVIKEGHTPMQHIRFDALSSKFQTEMSLFEIGRKRCDYPGRTILLFNDGSGPAFSSAGQFVTKIRSHLNDERLDELCFIKAYLQKHKK
ncbi:hypothetical protein TNCV_5102581 [Trichonephila clavipes]|nr:hypothetical protein TNCV_5102581 [Trichonephila clavipes]